MKRMKYTIFFCILFIGMMIIGESYIFKLDNFYAEYSNTSLYLQRETTEEEMKRDVLDSAGRNQVEVFAYIDTPASSFRKSIEIYGSKGVEPFINEHQNIKSGTYSSLFLGSLDFTFNDFNEIPDIGKVHQYYVIGEKDDVHQFKMELIDKYAGNHPKDGFPDKESKKNIISIWLLITAIALLLTFYDIVLQKKENLIRISMGERISWLVLKNITYDTAAYLGIFALTLLVLSKYTSVYFMFPLSLSMFGMLLLFNALLYVYLYFNNLKEVFSNVKGSKKLLALNYGLKLLTSVVTIMIISSNIGLIFESISLAKQKAFFEDYKDYYYTGMWHRPSETRNAGEDNVYDYNLNNSFHERFFEEFDATMITNYTYTNQSSDHIVANNHAVPYLSEKIKELQGKPLDKDIYFLVPEDLRDDKEILEGLEADVRAYKGEDFTYTLEVIYYQDNAEVVSIDENLLYGSKIARKPVILLDNQKPYFKKVKDENDSFTGLGNEKNIMYKLNDEKFAAFVKEHGMEGEIIYKNNVYENYMGKWTIAKRILYINFIFSALVLILEFIIITAIIKMEYEVNAIELSIKKVLGYSMAEKNRKIIFITIITTLLSILFAVFISIFYKLDEMSYLAAGGAAILVLEMAVIIFYIRRIEKAKIQSVLKGGNL